jgi:hypothetical protein
VTGLVARPRGEAPIAAVKTPLPRGIVTLEDVPLNRPSAVEHLSPNDVSSRTPRRILMLYPMLATATLIVCVALLGYLVILQRRRGRRGLEDTARLRSLHRWLSVLEEDRDPGESFVEYQARKQARPPEAGGERP